MTRPTDGNDELSSTRLGYPCHFVFAAFDYLAVLFHTGVLGGDHNQGVSPFLPQGVLGQEITQPERLGNSDQFAVRTRWARRDGRPLSTRHERVKDCRRSLAWSLRPNRCCLKRARLRLLWCLNALFAG